MSAAPIAKFLTEFDLRPPACRPPPQPLTAMDLAELEPIDISVLQAQALQAAQADGEALGRAAAQREFEARLAGDADAFYQRLLAEREKWRAEEAEQLALSFRQSLDAFEQSIAQSVARILTPFIGGQIAERMSQELGGALDDLLGQSDVHHLRIMGRADLVEALAARCAARGVAAECQVSDMADVSIICDSAVIETRLGAWMAALGAATKA